MSHLSDQPVFLQRNKKKSTLKDLNPKDIKIVNRITYKVLLAANPKSNCNQLRLVPAVPSKEDFMCRLNNKRDDLQYVKSSLKKVAKFRVSLSLTFSRAGSTASSKRSDNRGAGLLRNSHARSNVNYCLLRLLLTSLSSVTSIL